MGLIKCKVIPPIMLYHPFLPAKINIKFPLCAKYTDINQKQCNHNDKDRALVGTWVSLEVDKAKEKRYRIEKYYCVWHWDNLFERESLCQE